MLIYFFKFWIILGKKFFFGIMVVIIVEMFMVENEKRKNIFQSIINLFVYVLRVRVIMFMM